MRKIRYGLISADSRRDCLPEAGARDERSTFGRYEGDKKPSGGRERFRRKESINPAVLLLRHSPPVFPRRPQGSR